MGFLAEYSSYIVLGLFCLTILGLIFFQNKPSVIFGLLLICIYLFGFVSEEEILSNFSNTGVVTLVLLLVCSLALEKTRLIRVLTKYIVSQSYNGSWFKLFGFTAFSSAILNNSAVVATLIAPIRNNVHHAPSKLLIPLSYAAILGGTLTLVGTSTNLIVSSMSVEAGYGALSFFEFTKIGIFLLLACGATAFFSSKLLPSNNPTIGHVQDYFIEAEIQKKSPLVGNTVENNGLRNLESLFLVELIRGGRLISPVSPSEVIEPLDRLLFSGDVKKVSFLQDFKGLTLFANKSGLPLKNLSEVIIRADSMLVGKTLKKAGFRALFDAAVVAIKRDGKPLSGKLGETVLEPGDNLVLAVGQDYKFRHNISKNFYLISGVDIEPTLTRNTEWLASIGFLGAILCAALGSASLFSTLLILLAVLILTKTLTLNEILPRLPIQIWLIIASALTLSDALTNENVDALLKGLVINYSDVITPLAGLLTIYFVTWLLTELVTNNAAAALMLPLALSLAESLNINPIAFIMAIAFAASASFISPYGYQTNLMVFNAGSYKITDFIKVGTPVVAVYSIVTIIGINTLYL